MGWKNSPPPIFSTVTETIADMANQRIQHDAYAPPTHHLDAKCESILSPADHLSHLLTVFTAQIRSGELAKKGNPLQARSAKDYLQFLAQMFLSLGYLDPWLNSAKMMDF